MLTLVDTPGAANDAEAERQGAGAAIADLFAAVAAARTPVTTLLIGEGGSGGALALAAPGNTWATPDSYFSVIAPELAAAILKRRPEQTRATADQLRLRPQDLVDLGSPVASYPPTDYLETDCLGGNRRRPPGQGDCSFRDYRSDKPFQPFRADQRAEKCARARRVRQPRSRTPSERRRALCRTPSARAGRIPRAGRGTTVQDQTCD